MYNVKLLTVTLNLFYRTAVTADDYTEESVAAMLDEIDEYSLLQAVRHNARTVYAYTTQGKQDKSFNYRGRDLFGQRATLLYEDFDQNTAEAVLTDRTYELWLLEDMTFAVVSRVSVDFDNGAYRTEYREICGKHPWDSPMCIDLEELTGNLKEMCVAVYESEQPVYEL